SAITEGPRALREIGTSRCKRKIRESSTRSPVEVATRRVRRGQRGSREPRQGYSYCVTKFFAWLGGICGRSKGIAVGHGRARRSADDALWRLSWGRGAAAGSAAPRGR